MRFEIADKKMKLSGKETLDALDTLDALFSELENLKAKHQKKAETTSDRLEARQARIKIELLDAAIDALEFMTETTHAETTAHLNVGVYEKSPRILFFNFREDEASA